MKDRFEKLLTVKSLVTLTLTGVFAFLSSSGKVSSDQFLTIFTVIIGFYFGTQHERKVVEVTEKVDAMVNTEEVAK